MPAFYAARLQREKISHFIPRNVLVPLAWPPIDIVSTVRPDFMPYNKRVAYNSSHRKFFRRFIVNRTNITSAASLGPLTTPLFYFKYFPEGGWISPLGGTAFIKWSGCALSDFSISEQIMQKRSLWRVLSCWQNTRVDFYKGETRTLEKSKYFYFRWFTTTNDYIRMYLFSITIRSKRSRWNELCRTLFQLIRHHFYESTSDVGHQMVQQMCYTSGN